MRRVLAGSIGVLLLVALAVPAFAATETVKGRIVDQSCYMKDTKNNTSDTWSKSPAMSSPMRER